MPIETTHLVALQSPRGQDRTAVIPCAGATVIVVADGAGGRPGGAQAADGVVRHLQAMIVTGGVPGDALECMTLLRRVDESLAQDSEAGETTGVLVVVSELAVYGASVGDSGAWLIGPESWTDLTGNQVRKPFLGFGAAVPGPFAAPRGDGTLLVATDGLLKYTSPERICALVRTTEFSLTPARLIEEVRYPSGQLPDDIAIVLARWRRLSSESAASAR